MSKKASKSRELTTTQCLGKISPLIEKKYKIIENIYRIYEHNDDPKFFHFVARLYPVTNTKDDEASNAVSGFSILSEEDALLKCIGEAIERHSIRSFNYRKFIKSKHKDLKENAVNPKSFVSFSNKQKRNKNFSIFRIDKNTEYRWLKGVNLISELPTLVPAQLLYLYYKLLRNEKWIYLPISTGTAGGSSRLGSITRAIYEIIERDAFLIYYLNKIPGKKIDIEKINSQEIVDFWRKIQKHKLQVNCFDITSDIKIPTVLTIVIDETGIGPAVSLGLKSNLDVHEAILGSLQESLHPRGWIRQKVQKDPSILKKHSLSNPFTLEDRALFWYPLDRIKDINFMLKTNSKIIYNNQTRHSLVSQFKLIQQLFKKQKMDLYYIDVSVKEAKMRDYFVSRILIPQLYPFYLIEDYPYLGGNRLYDVPYDLGLISKKNSEDTLNKVPHPFI